MEIMYYPENIREIRNSDAISMLQLLRYGKRYRRHVAGNQDMIQYTYFFSEVLGTISVGRLHQI